MSVYEKALTLFKNNPEIETTVQELLSVDENDLEESYEELIDSEGDVEIGQLSYSRSAVLKAVDPVAYNVGFADYLGSGDIIEINGYYYYENELDDYLDNL